MASWRPVDKLVVALFNFPGQGEQQLPLEVGDMLCVLEENAGWYRGHHYHNPSHKGVFPACLVHDRKHSMVKIGKKSHMVPSEDEVAMETGYLLKEWQTKLRDYYLSGQRTNYTKLLGMMEGILSSRRHLLKSNATVDVLQSLRTKLTAKLDQVNQFLQLPVSPRDDNGKLLDCHDTGLHRLYRVHEDRRKELDSRVAQTGALKKKEDDVSSSRHIHHLFARVNKVDHEAPEDCEVFFFLYNSETPAQVSERLMMHTAGQPGTLGRGAKVPDYSLDKRAALFTDLGARDIETSGMHLVCQMVRRGKMLLDDKKNVNQTPYRRPYACGVMEVSSLLQAPEDTNIHEEDFKNATFSMPLYVCGTNHESDFSSFHNNVIKKTGARPGQKPGCAISLTIKAFHGDLNEVKKNYPSTFEKPMEIVHKLGFPDVILPGDVRNDIYITVEHGTFEKGTKRSERNVEVAIEVFDGSKQVIPRAIVLGAGGKQCSEYESFIFYHNNTPRWEETFKLSIPVEKLPDAHLRICFRHVAKAEARDKSEKTFAFAFLKIMRDDGSIIPDGQHELYVYKADHKKSCDPKTYLSYASCKEDVLSNRSSQTFSSKMIVDATTAGGTSLARSFKETVVVSTLTCSTKLTQKIELLMLLKWRQRERDLGVVLTNMLHIGGEEVVKFLQDTLDCLFDILNANQQVYGEKIFEVLVSICGLMQDDKYQHFKTVLDIYITKHFSAMLAHKFLVWIIEKHVREYGHIPNLHSKKLCPVLKSMQYLFRFMIQSHALYKKTNKKEDPTFVEELKQIFSTFSALMGYQENKVKDVYLVQSIMLANLPCVLGDVVTVLPETTIAELISQFLDSIRNTHATLPQDKLQFMLRILDSPLKLFHNAESRRQLIPTYVSHLISYLDHTMSRTSYKPDVQSNIDCMTCVGRLLEVLADEEVGATDEDVERMVTLLMSLLRLSKAITRNNPLYVQNVVNLIGLLSIMQDKHYASLFATQKSTYGSALKDFLIDFMLAITNIIKYPIFPNNWVTLYLMQSRVLARALANISKALIDAFLGAHSFNPLIWDEYFSICTSFVTQPCLQLEEYSDYRRNTYLQQFGDLRVATGRQVILLWHKLGSHKGQFIPDLINSFLKISLLKQRDLRRFAIPLVFDVVKCEQEVNGNFKRVETEVFDKVDELVFSGQGDEEYKEMFSEILISQCESNPMLKSSVMGFIENVTRLIALLLDYRHVPADDANRGRRMGCMLNLLQFYKDIEKEELYVKYIYKLTELHEKDQSFTEAGFTLLLHAKGLEWNTDKLEAAVGKFPIQTGKERKEQLYMRAIELFDRGKSWECGIPLCKELAHQYEAELFDYTKLAAILQREAEFFRKIIDIQQLRVAPEYFMVGYYGKGFPLFLRNKIFIHRGQPYEKLGAFIKRLTDEFTSAEVLKTTTPPESDIQNSNGMYLQVRTVVPIPKEHDRFEGKTVPEKIGEYYQTNDVEEFRYDRPFHKGKKNKECEFASLWIGRTTFTTVSCFPGVISWFEVSKIKELELDPLSIALETVESKNQEIQLQTAIYLADKSLSINPLSMLLNGVIDAAVMGGIGNYEKIFFNPSYTSEHPEDADRVKKLRSLIEEQTVVLEKALTLHGQRIDQSLQEFHSKLERCFEDFQGIVFPEKRKPKQRKVMRSATIARPLPPTPGISGGAGSGPSTPIGIGHTTLPNKARRATGVVSRRITPSYEDTEIDPPPSFSKNRVFRKSSSPSPMFGGSSALKPHEESPKLPSPYMSKKQLGVSPSSGDGSDLSKRFSSSQHSSTSSLNQLSDIDQDAYEPIADFLMKSSDPPSLTSSSVPQPRASAILEQDELMSTSVQSSFSPPSYPAPIPPKKGRAARAPERLNEEDEDEDEGYTKVKLEGGQVEIEGYTDDVERAPLPLLSTSTSARSSLAGGDSSQSSPFKYAGTTGSGGGSRQRSPSAPDVTFGSIGFAPSPSKTTSVSSSNRVLLPPEPTSPPPSPPVDQRDPTPPIPISIKSPSPLLIQQNLARDDGSRSATPPEAHTTTEEQPKLPPKKRNVASISSSFRETDDDIYAFDTLDPPSSTVPPKPSPTPTSTTQANIDDDIYTFDTLEQPPPMPTKTKPTSGPSSYVPQTSEGEYNDGENIYEFDNLEDEPITPVAPPVQPKRPEPYSPGGVKKKGSVMRPPKPTEEPPPIPRKSITARSSISSAPSAAAALPQRQSYQFQDDDDVYSFDSLEPPPPPAPAKPFPGKKPDLPTPYSKPPQPTPSPTITPDLQMHDDDDVYVFDSLEPAQGRPGSSGAVSNPSPEVGGSNASDSPPDQTYFDHLVTGQRPLPPPGKPPPKYGAAGVAAGKPPTIPPKNSPPAVKRKGNSPSSSPESAAPPIPMKKRTAKTSISGEADMPRPVARPRGATIVEGTPSIPPRPSNPQLPPKPALPNIPPKPAIPPKANGDSKPPPPIPSKNLSKQWPPKR